MRDLTAAGSFKHTHTELMTRTAYVVYTPVLQGFVEYLILIGQLWHSAVLYLCIMTAEQYN